MQFTSDVEIIGFKKISFKADDGRLFDYVNLYTKVQLDQSQGNAQGEATESYQWQGSKNFDALTGRKFPILAKVKFEMVTNGKSSKLAVLDVQLPPKV